MRIDVAKTRVPPPSLDRKGGDTGGISAVNVFNSDKKGEYYLIKLDQLVPFKHQARIYFDEDKTKELAATIKDHGLRQPLTIIKSSTDPGKYEIVSGERRFRAAQYLKMEKVPCIILENNESADEVALIENIQREDLHPIELGKAYMQLYKSGYCKTHQEIADKIGVPRSQVTEYIAFGNIEDSDATFLIKNQISERKYLRKIVLIKDPTKRSEFINSVSAINIEPIAADEAPKADSAKIVRKSQLVSLYLRAGQVECVKKSFKNLTSSERQALETTLTDLLTQIKQ